MLGPGTNILPSFIEGFAQEFSHLTDNLSNVVGVLRVNTAMWRNLLFLMSMIFPGLGLAHDFGARIDGATWHLEPSPLKCRLWQAVPNYGDAVFELEAGQDLKFYIDSYRPVDKPGQAKVSIVAPNWRPDISPKPIGETRLQTGRRPIELAHEVANQLLAELMGGMYPSFSHPGWYDPHPVQVNVSAVNFQDAYSGYMSCVAGLYPAGYSDLKLSLLHFETNKYGIKGKLKQRLDLIAGYIALDPSVKKIYVDGHTDSDGRRGHNWELSRLRAQEVKDYLESQGIFPEMVEMRYHGEGRPARRNSNKANKAVNRRVSVRLTR